MTLSNPNVVLGLWPIAGVTTLGVTEEDARSTIETAIECGITAFDTAFSYGFDGESDRHLRPFLQSERERFTVISKVGQRWNDQGRRVIDGSRETLTMDAETSLRRLGIEQFDLLMLHCPDPQVPLEESAAAIERLQQRGLCRRVGVCNVNHEEQRRFASAVKCDAIQCPLNLLQQETLDQLIPQCQQQDCEVLAFWVLMKGLLAGRIARDHVFREGDSRPSYEIFQGARRARAHQVLDGLAAIATETGLTIAQLSIGWALSQTGVSSVLVGARRPDQIRETAAAVSLTSEVAQAISRLVEDTN